MNEIVIGVSQYHSPRANRAPYYLIKTCLSSCILMEDHSALQPCDSNSFSNPMATSAYLLSSR